MTTTLVFNGKKYAHLPGKYLGDCNGFFEKSSNGGVKLYKPSGELDAFIVNNAQQGQFVVTAGTAKSGVPFYMFSTSSLTEEWLSLADMGLAAQTDAIKAMRFVDDNAKLS
ncbi:hypothetical protein [Cupriavidus sp. TMH.W2]|uniref:hypothetical protein n=1 Tax=Cupriavidus sp. TMH.W2 TaxID=3434465 RepID=UPI003D772647